MNIRRATGIMVLALLTVAAPGVAAVPPDGPAWQAFLARLNSPDAKTRAAAIEDLHFTLAPDLPQIRQALVGATDPAVRTALHDKLVALKKNQVDLPGISLELKDATFDQTWAAFNSAASSPLRGNSSDPQSRPKDPARFTIAAHNQPFWEVFADLSRQGGWLPTEDREELGIAHRLEIDYSPDSPATGLHTYQINGPVIVYVDQLLATSTLSYQAGGAAAAPSQTTLHLKVAVDPRLHVIQCKIPRITSMIDDLGAELCKPPAEWTNEEDRRPGVSEFAATSTNVLAETFPVPPTHSRKIASLKGVAVFRVAITDEEDLPNVKDLSHKTVKVGPVTLAFANNRSDIAADTGVNFTGSFPEGQPVWCTIVNGPGVVDSRYKMVQGSEGIYRRDFVGPMTFHIEWSVGTKDLEIPFELKDLPLP